MSLSGCEPPLDANCAKVGKGPFTPYWGVQRTRLCKGRYLRCADIRRWSDQT